MTSRVALAARKVALGVGTGVVGAGLSPAIETVEVKAVQGGAGREATETATSDA